MLEKVESLLEKQPELKLKRNVKGKTALDIAVEKGFVEIAKLLLKE